MNANTKAAFCCFIDCLLKYPVANDNVNNVKPYMTSRSVVAVFIAPVFSDSLGHLV